MRCNGEETVSGNFVQMYTVVELVLPPSVACLHLSSGVIKRVKRPQSCKPLFHHSSTSLTVPHGI